jgi:ketosteroid isomerase-like protein
MPEESTTPDLVELQKRLTASCGAVQLRYGTVSVWEGGKITRITNYTDIDEARRAAERLAEARG